MSLTFRARLTLWNVVILTSLLGVTASALVYALDRVAERRFDAALLMIGAGEAGSVARRARERGPEEPGTAATAVAGRRDLLRRDDVREGKYVMVVGDDGKVVDFSANLETPFAVDRAALERSLAGEVVFQRIADARVGPLRAVYVPAAETSTSRALVVVVGLPETIGGDLTRHFSLLVGLAFVALASLTAAGSLLLAGRAIEPVEEIAAAAESVSALTLKHRLPEPRADDQIGRLVRVFNRMLARLEAAFEAQRQFTSRAAHELRTPLTILKGETQVALARERSVPEYEALLKSNLEEIDKLVLMIGDLLVLARYEGGTLDTPCEAVRLEGVAAEVAHDLLAVAAERGIDLRVEAERSPAVRGDSRAIERLVYNLVDNGLAYTPRGGAVVVRVAHEGGRVRLEVEDTGIGIAPEDVPNLYEQFFRSAAAREVRPHGSGVGLPVVAAVARVHGASVEVTSRPGAGTRFAVTFPAGAAHAGRDPSPEPFH